MSTPATSLLYFENVVGRVEEDPRGFVRLRYAAGRRDPAAYRDLLQHVLRLLARRRHGRMLVDQRMMEPFTPQEQEWLLGEWLPQAITEGGYKHGAIIQAQNVFARLAMSTSAAHPNAQQLTYRYFDDEAAAVAWLLQQ
ncbi:STAS/SEC14 domain-containing protein [Hymenobacter weizhouensis]|uniref:STAS/SEC14 domain-containing protein n=1 Tax=Hymenobacter sp. YIM 151500-1 TaxID=2987689 RepID=UPI0022265F85|nr:STAS/SEC14 domain-containing protein [Hymenobacter sp. YIM 151500-1]UYZ61487.1 STAS/SEC14 domain-containing protein [Hymenobacter sp. YIM 151500-1]